LYDGKRNKIHKEAKNHKEASEQGVKQTLNTRFSCSGYYAWKRKWKQWAKRVFSWNID
jgi:hypothetical protein